MGLQHLRGLVTALFHMIEGDAQRRATQSMHYSLGRDAQVLSTALLRAIHACQSVCVVHAGNCVFSLHNPKVKSLKYKFNFESWLHKSSTGPSLAWPQLLFSVLRPSLKNQGFDRKKMCFGHRSRPTSRPSLLSAELCQLAGTYLLSPTFPSGDLMNRRPDPGRGPSTKGTCRAMRIQSSRL